MELAGTPDGLKTPFVNTTHVGSHYCFVGVNPPKDVPRLELSSSVRSLVCLPLGFSMYDSTL